MAVRKRGGRWHVDFMIRRVRYREAVPEARTKQEALDAEAEIRRSVYEGRYGRRAANALFEQFVKEVFLRYSEANRKRYDLDQQLAERFCRFFRGKRFAEISPMLVERFKKELRDEGLKNSTVNQYLAVLNRVFSLAVENGYTNQNPLAKVRRLRVEHRERYMTAEEERRLREHLPSPLLPCLDLWLNTGMRARELLLLDTSEVDLKGAAVTLPASRTKEKRKKVIPLNPEAVRILSSLMDDCGHEGRLFGRGYELSYFNKQWKAACKEAGVRDLHVHDLRHTCATRMAERGVPESAISAILGHSSGRMTKRYVHATPESVRAAVEALAEKVCLTFVTRAEEKAG